MRTKIVIKIPGISTEKGRSKAMKIAAEIEGVESVTRVGKDKSTLVVVGDGVDCSNLTTLLRRKVGHADVVELLPLHDTGGGGGGGGYYAARSGLARDTGYGGNYSYPSAPIYTPAPPEYYRQQPYEYYQQPPPPYGANVVPDEYYPPGASDPNGCCIM